MVQQEKCCLNLSAIHSLVGFYHKNGSYVPKLSRIFHKLANNSLFMFGIAQSYAVTKTNKNMQEKMCGDREDEPSCLHPKFLLMRIFFRNHKKFANQLMRLRQTNVFCI